MVQRIRRQHYRFLWRIGVILLVVAPFLALVTILLPEFDVELGPIAKSPTMKRVLASLATGALVLGSLLTIAKVFLSWTFDPNGSEIEVRLRLGHSLAFDRDPRDKTDF
jgi:hypothetical protein